MIDCGKTSPYVLMCLDVYLNAFEYLGLDWESELGTKLHEIMISVSNSLPDVIVLNEHEDCNLKG